MYFRQSMFLASFLIILFLKASPAGAQLSQVIIINNNSKYSNSKDGIVSLFISMPKAKEMMISNFEDFSTGVWENYASAKEWSLTKGEGIKTVFVKFKDLTNKESNTFKASIVIDSTPPKAIFVSINGDSKYVNQSLKLVNIILKAEDAAQMRLSNDPSFEGIRWINYSDSVRNWSLSGNDGEKVVYAEFKDLAGNTSQMIKDEIILDRTPPSEISIKINDGSALTNNNKVKLSITAKDAAEMMIKQPDSKWVPFDNEVVHFELQGEDGVKIVSIRLKDAAGNISLPVSGQIKLDRKPPLNCKIALNNNAVFTADPLKKVNLKLYAEEAYELAVRQDTNFSSALWESYKTSVNIILQGDDGAKRVYARFKDVAGNISPIVSDEIVLDRTKPELGSITINKGQSVINNPSVILNLQASDARQMIISGNSSFTGSVWQKYEAVKGFVLQGADGVKSVYVKFKDAAGNVSEISTASVTLDRKAPVGPKIKIDNASGFTTDKDGLVTLSLECEGAAEMMISNVVDFKGALWQVVQPSVSWKLAGADGLKVVGVKFRDHAGNESTVATAKIKLARSASVSGSFTINSDSLITKNVNKRVDLLLKAQGAKEMLIANSQDLKDGIWEEFKTEKVWTLFDGDGEKTVYVKFKGFVGNESKTYTDKIILDRTAPSNGKVVINNDSLFTVNKKNQVRLFIYAEGATYMMISNNPILQGAVWEPYKTTKIWQLDKEDGIKNIYIKFKDEIGNESEIISDRILLDKTPPQNVSLKINNGADFTNHPNKAVTLVFDHDDATQVRISNTPNVEDKKWEKVSNKKLNWILPGEDGEKTVYVQYMDDGKNLSQVVFDKIILDRKPPRNCSFTINNDSAYTNNIEADVKLYMKGEEVKGILISNTKDFFGARWEAFKSFKGHWILDGPDGEKIVYMLFRDEAGNLYPDTLSHKIILDRTPPANIVVTAKEGKVDYETKKVTLNLKAADAEWMEVRIRQENEGKWEQYVESKQIDLSEGDKNIVVRFKDIAGNISDFVPLSYPQ